MRKALLIAITAVLCALGVTMTAVAAPQSSGNAMQSQAQSSVSQAELQKFANTYKAVTMIRDKYQARLQHADDKQQAQKIATHAEQAMKASIEQHGFTMKEYTRVVQAINNDPQLQQEFVQLTGGTGGR
ncbi:MAG TPA: DUF4168 domain-containing protein [Gammaproteobacteria bacterium]|nr:DUF4168 domain-containing protein [Gammaproteobacteria bacterium]